MGWVRLALEGVLVLVLTTKKEKEAAVACVTTEAKEEDYWTLAASWRYVIVPTTPFMSCKFAS